MASVLLVLSQVKIIIMALALFQKTTKKPYRLQIQNVHCHDIYHTFIRTQNWLDRYQKRRHFNLFTTIRVRSLNLTVNVDLSLIKKVHLNLVERIQNVQEKRGEGMLVVGKILEIHKNLTHTKLAIVLGVVEDLMMDYVGIVLWHHTVHVAVIQNTDCESDCWFCTA